MSNETDKLAVIILDALDDYNSKQLEMDYIDSLIKEGNSEVLGVSSLPYTAQSNPLIWGGYDNQDKFWVDPGTEKWSFPAGAFDRGEGDAVDNARKAWDREDFDTTFIWDELHHEGVDACAIHIPIVLPPYSFNPVEGFDMGDHWFPHSEEQIREHGNEMPEAIREHVESGKDFIAASIQIPDKLLHVLGENDNEKRWAAEIGREFDRNMKELIEFMESEDYDWILLGDHGSPWPGNIKVPEARHFVPNHRKNTVIISNMDVELPGYTDQMYSFLRDIYDMENAVPEKEEQEKLEEEAAEALREAVEEEALFLFTGGKEALVISHMLLQRIGDGGQPVPYGVVDTGNHFEEMQEFRTNYCENRGIELKKKRYDQLLEKVILNEEDPRGFHGYWDEDRELPENTEGIASRNSSREEWGVKESCGALKVTGIKKFIEDGFETLITGQRIEDDLTVKEDPGVWKQREEPDRHTRVNPLANWSRENVWRYISKHDLEYPVLYDRGYNHTDSKCCTRKPNAIGEHGQKGVDIEKRQVVDQLKELGYM